MITLIEPERGGESEGILRIEFSMPWHPDEVREFRDWLEARGWSVEVDQIDSYFRGEGIDA